ncbi:unnamed protein product [Rotaria socialis]|uniref:Uncharacterized protein n=1 Tax=Rotaria socialis TaxID=392032 RepID=A0A820VST8_9BILA|nr:unnamed protein product [Rotaria socialis]
MSSSELHFKKVLLQSLYPREEPLEFRTCLRDLENIRGVDLGFKKLSYRQYLFYTLPWIFDELFQFCLPDKYISELRVFTPASLGNTVGLSRLIKRNIVDNIASSTTSLSRVMSSNQIVELHLSRCDGLDSLSSCSFLSNIRSIQITLNYERFHSARADWTNLRVVSTLPFLNSLRLLLYGMHIPPNDTSCQIIAETASMVADFCLCF